MDLHSENNGHRLILYLPGYNSHKRNYDTINKTAAMTFWGEVIIAQTDVISVLLQSFHLIVNLLGDATMLRKAMIDKEQYLHTFAYFLQM